jgi:hypothetical protein
MHWRGPAQSHAGTWMIGGPGTGTESEKSIVMCMPHVVGRDIQPSHPPRLIPNPSRRVAHSRASTGSTSSLTCCPALLVTTLEKSAKMSTSSGFDPTDIRTEPVCSTPMFHRLIHSISSLVFQDFCTRGEQGRISLLNSEQQIIKSFFEMRHALLFAHAHPE